MNLIVWVLLFVCLQSAMCLKNRYHGESLSAEQLITEFSSHPCCNGNCVVTIAGLPGPSPGDVYCTECYPDGFSGPTISCCPSSMSDIQKKTNFMLICEATRAPYEMFTPKAKDSTAKLAEKKKNLTGLLMTHFKLLGRNTGSGWDWDDCYYIIMPDGKRKNVCKNAWLAMTGVTKGGCEWVQSKIRKGEDAFAYIGDDAKEIINEKQGKHPISTSFSSTILLS